MGRKSRKIIKKLEKKVIKNLGQDVTIRRNQYFTDNTDGLDLYGEPSDPDNYTNVDYRTIRIVVDRIKEVEELTSVGGMSSPKKEILCCYISQSEDIAIGDVIYYPAGSEKQYEIDEIEPYVLEDEVLILEVKARRDLTTK